MKMRLRRDVGEVDVRVAEDTGEVDPGLLAWLGTDIVRWDRCGLVVRSVERQVLVRDGWWLARWPDGRLAVFGAEVAKMVFEGADGDLRA